MKKKIVYVMSANFSGSTMLGYMLANQRQGFAVGECYAYFWKMRPHHDRAICTCFNNDCELWKKWHSLGEQNLYTNIFNDFPEVNYIVDSSKTCNWIDKQVEYNKDKYDIYFIVVYKSPKVWYYSLLNRPWSDNKIEHYIRIYNVYMQRFAKLGKFYVVNFESLTSNISEYLEKICNKIGIEYKDKQEEFWSKTHHALYGSDTAKIHLAKPESKEFEKLANARIKAKKNKPFEISKHRQIYTDGNFRSIEVPQRYKQELHNLIFRLRGYQINATSK